MSKRVDPTTLLCFAHDVPGCVCCMTDDFWDALAEAKAKRAAAKAEAKALTVDERFDLGGES